MQGIFSLGTFIPKLPPSDLGFVCKAELPPHINILFRARPPLKYIEIPHKEKRRNYTGLFDLVDGQNILSRFETKPPENLERKVPKRIQRLINIIQNKEKQKEENKENLKKWEPESNSEATSNPYKTLFVYKLDKNATENDLKYHFEDYGPIKMVKIIRNRKGVSRGYAFVEYEHTKDFKEALRKGHRKKINGMYVSVDKERGRTDSKFKPRKYGGGKGRGREFPSWLEDELYMVKKKYPDLVKKSLKASESRKEKGNTDNIKNKSEINTNKNKETKEIKESQDRKIDEKIELELGEIEDEKIPDEKKDDKKNSGEVLKQKRRRSKKHSKDRSRSKSKSFHSRKYSSDSSYNSYLTHSSGRKHFGGSHHGHKHYFLSNGSDNKKDKEMKENKEKKETKGVLEEGEID